MIKSKDDNPWSDILEEFIWQMFKHNVYTQDDTPRQTTQDLKNGQEPCF